MSLWLSLIYNEHENEKLCLCSGEHIGPAIEIWVQFPAKPDQFCCLIISNLLIKAAGKMVTGYLEAFNWLINLSLILTPSEL